MGTTGLSTTTGIALPIPLNGGRPFDTDHGIDGDSMLQAAHQGSFCTFHHSRDAARCHPSHAHAREVTVRRLMPLRRRVPTVVEHMVDTTIMHGIFGGSLCHPMPSLTRTRRIQCNSGLALVCPARPTPDESPSHHIFRRACMQDRSHIAHGCRADRICDVGGLEQPETGALFGAGDYRGFGCHCCAWTQSTNRPHL